jgi:hypothetical protein
MFSSLRRNFGIPGVIAVIALVFAMIGGAYAASGVLTSKQKKEVKNIAKKYAGVDGQNGAPGAAGKDGAPGAAGKDGAPGAAGQNGKSVDLINEAPSQCVEGGFTYEIEGSNEENEVCNGEDGETGFTEKLPAGKTETGSWSVPSDVGVGNPSMPEGNAYIPISFPIPLTTAPTFVAVKSLEDKSAEGCAAKVENTGALEGGVPLAGSNKLCVYLATADSFDNSTTISVLNPTLGGTGASTSKSGIILKVNCGAAACLNVKGTWAVTG